MINALRSEWIKLRSVRMNLVLCIIAVALPLLVSILTSALVNANDLDTQSLAGTITATSVITALLLGVIGVVSIGGEFSHGTIRPTFAATPRRSRVLIAKGVITAGAALLVEGAVVVLAYGVSSAIASSRGASISLADHPEARNGLIGIVVFAVIVSLLGFALGLLIRNMPSAIAVLILWPLLIESIIGGLLTAAGVEHAFKWLPFQAGVQLGNPDDGSGGGDLLARVPAGLYFAAVTLVVAVVGASFTNRRDA
jgi:ABC-2 type transport system permease protein